LLHLRSTKVADPTEEAAKAVYDGNVDALGEDAKHLKHGLAARGCGVDPLLVQEQVNAGAVEASFRAW
jgi:hypothetical protein